MMGSLTMLVGRTAIALALCLASAGMANAEMRTCGSQDPVDTINEMFAALYACWEPPANAGGLSMTLTFSLRSNRSEEHTSELQSRENLVCRLLLEKKKNNN